MTVIEMLGQSGVLAILGMSTVIGFIAILVMVISLVGKLIIKIYGSGTAALAAETKANKDDGRVTAAITAAINEYQKNN